MSENAYNNSPEKTHIVDESGKPLKNRFGMKLAFAVLEILSLFFCNIITMVLGIVALVLICAANNNYKKGEIKEFKSNAKISAILLWIGLALDVVVIAVWIVLFSSRAFQGYRDFYQAYVDEKRDGSADDNADGDDDTDGGSDADTDDDGDMDTDDDLDADDDTEWDLDLDDLEAEDDIWDTSDYVAADADKMGEYWKFTLEGNELELPCGADELLDAGYVFGDQDLDTGEVELRDAAVEELEAKDNTELMFLDSDAEVILGSVTIYNPTDKTIKESEGVIISVCLYNDLAYDGDYHTEMTLSGGVSFDSTRDELLEAWGTSSYTDEESGYDEWTVDPDDTNNYIYVSFDENGTIMDIYLAYTGDYTIE